MKRFLIVSLILISCSVFAQDTDPAVDFDVYPAVPFYYDTLTVTNDTMDVDFERLSQTDKDQIVGYTIVAKTISGTDTLNVFTLSRDERFWTQKALTDLSADTTANVFPVTTTAKEFEISDPAPSKIRIISTSNDGSSTLITVSAKGE
jgi:hypothetical protein